MAKASEIAAELEEISETMKLRLKAGITKIGGDLLAEIIENSVVDTGTYRSEWDIDILPSYGNVVASASIYNRLPYALPIEIGSEKGKPPWPGVGKKTNIGKKKKGKGKGKPKTVEKNNRIWSRQAVGGVMTPIIEGEKFLDKQLEALSEFILD